MKRFFSLLLSAMMLLSLANTAYATDSTGKSDNSEIITAPVLTEYQEIIDKLNEEYGYSMTFSPDVFSRNSAFDPLAEYSLLEFEAELRKEIEDDIAVDNEARAAVAALEGAEWEDVPFTGHTYTIPTNVSYMSSQVLDIVCQDAVSFIADARTMDNQIGYRATDKTLTSVLPRLDPTGNVVFFLNAKISTSNYWKFSSVTGFAYGFPTNAREGYYPQSMSRSYLDSLRTVAATFTCTHYSASGVVINSNVSVYREFYASGDCFTNSPDYTIPKTYTNKTYKQIENIDGSMNCAGYAWNYSDFVDMGSLGISYDDLNNCSSLSALRSLVKNKSESFMSNHNIRAIEINSYDTSINPSTQYRVVMRVGYDDTNRNGKWDFSPYPGYDSFDYHWWMQLGDGTWADKRGYLPTRIIPNSTMYSNPESLSWSMYYYGELQINNFYNSTPVYYKITG